MKAFNRVSGVALVSALLAAPATAPVATTDRPTVPNPRLLTPQKPDAAARATVQAALSRLPLSFIENRGQVDGRVAYYVEGRDTTLYFTAGGVTLVLGGPTRWVLKLDFVGANPHVWPTGRDATAPRISYFKGPREQWKTGLRAYSSLVYPELWPGIDLVYSAGSDQLKYTFVVKPGADPNRIRLAYRGATGLSLAEDGRLVVRTAVDSFADARPHGYQEGEGGRVGVALAYALHSQREYGFDVGAYDEKKPLVIDPVVLVYAGFIGGSADDYGEDIAVILQLIPDSVDNAYVTGWTQSTQVNFPEKEGPDLTSNGGTDAFVAKVTAAGVLAYAGYIGGAGDDEGHGIAVDILGNAYVTGTTTSTEATFPVKGGPDLTFNGVVDAFVAKVNPSGTALVYAGYIGGSADDYGQDIALDKAGTPYVSGYTASTEATFPVKVGPDLTFNGAWDAFVAKVDPTGAGLSYAGYIGGSQLENGDGIAVDSAGRAYVAGTTGSTEATFPVKAGPDLTFNGGGVDAFVAKVNPTGTALVYAGYLGGSGYDLGLGIAVDSTGSAYVTGGTDSTQATFPVKGGPDPTYNGGLSDAFVAKVRPSGASLLYAGYIGGSGNDSGSGIAVDSKGNAYVAGRTNSTDFPVKVGPGLTFNGDAWDAFVAKVRQGGAALLYAGYIGGSGQDQGSGIAVDPKGNAYVTGFTFSTQATFPEKLGPDLTHNGVADAFVAKIFVSP